MCDRCQTRPLRLWPSAPGVWFACFNPVCRLQYGPQLESDGTNIYMCFHCNFTLCARCVRSYYGTRATQNEGGTGANICRSESTADSEVQPETVTIEIGDEVLRLPPSYDEIRLLQLEQPPSYDACTKV